MIDTNELRRLAQAATPGPWYVTGKLTRYVEARIDGGLIQEVAACGPTKADGGYGPQQEANARLIAAANPATISELLDRLEAAEKERDNANAAAAGIALQAETLQAERDALRDKITETEKQEPVAWRTFDGEGGYDFRSYEDNENYKLGWDARNPNHRGWVEPLYALPGAQNVPSVPEGFALVNAAHFLAVLDREDWRTAKNRAELRAMLAAAPEAKS